MSAGTVIDLLVPRMQAAFGSLDVEWWLEFRRDCVMANVRSGNAKWSYTIAGQALEDTAGYAADAAVRSLKQSVLGQ